MNDLTATHWNRHSLRHCHGQPDKARRVQAMFDRIARRYDLLNHLLSFNLDRQWRRRALAAAQLAPGQTFLDLCCGTGDLARAALQRHPGLKAVWGIDFAEAMLARARHKSNEVRWLQADVCRLPLPSATVDAAACAFGVRNVQDTAAFLSEVSRVLRPGGRLVILDFGRPGNPLLRLGYELHCRVLMPVTAALLVGRDVDAYRYLPSSVRQFDRADLERQVAAAGLFQRNGTTLTGGVVFILVAHKPW